MLSGSMDPPHSTMPALPGQTVRPSLSVRTADHSPAVLIPGDLNMTTPSTDSASSVRIAGLSVSSRISSDRGLSSLLETLRRARACARGLAGGGPALTVLASFCFATPALPPSLAPEWYQQSTA